MNQTQESRVAIIAIIVEHGADVAKLNQLLHQYADYIIGRMGIPYPKKQINLISVAIDAPSDIISALSGKIGRLSKIAVKTTYSKA